MNVLAVEHVKLNVQLALFLRAQIILRLMLTLVWTVALALLSVLQELSPRVRNCEGATLGGSVYIDNEKIRKKRCSRCSAFFVYLTPFYLFCIYDVI